MTRGGGDALTAASGGEYGVLRPRDRSRRIRADIHGQEAGMERTAISFNRGDAWNN